MPPERLPARMARVQKQARTNMTTFHHRSGPAQLAAYGPMWLAGRLLPGVINSRLDWLYGHDVVG